MKRATSILAFFGVAFLAWGCSGNKDVDSQGLPSQTLIPDTARASEARPEPAPRPPAETLIVIEPGAEGDSRLGLIEASRAERKRRAELGQPAIVLTDQNLEEYQEGAQLTFVHEEEGSEGGDETLPTTPGEDALPLEIGERYWRDRGLQIRTGWRESIDRIEKLQGDLAEYRRRFYEEDDPSIRDSLIKPAWDRAIEELDEARAEARELEKDLQAFLDLGYQSGAYEEWLDEGASLEPSIEQLERVETQRTFIQFDEPSIAPEDLEDGDSP